MSNSANGPVILSRYLALAWFGLVVYGSLHPFSGWRMTGAAPLAFIEAEWPRYWTYFDLLANVAVYLPLGFFLTLALRRLPWRYTAPILAILLSGSLSLALEAIQNWLPSRVPSSLDLLCNTLGGLIGAVAAQHGGPRLFARIALLEKQLLAPVPHAELGLTVLGLWLLVPLSPETWLFGAGDFRALISFQAPIPFSADRFALIEAAVAGCNALAVGLILRRLIKRVWLAYVLVPLFLLLGLTIRTLGAAVLIGPAESLAWLTPGAGQGLLGGLLALSLSLWLPARLSLLLAMLALVAGTLILNLAPGNPYSEAALAAWRQGHFLNFNGLTRLVASLWPFLALPFLFLTLQRR